MENKVILKFEHNNGNCVRIVENVEHTFSNRYHVQSKGPNTRWVTNKIYREDTKHAHIKKFYEICKAVEHVTIIPYSR